MDVEDLLHGGFAIGEKEIHALTPQPAPSERSRSPMSDPHEVGSALGINVGEIGAVGDRHDEKMAGVHRLNVHEGRASVVAIHKACGQLAGEGATEKALGHHCSVERSMRRISSVVIVIAFLSACASAHAPPPPYVNATETRRPDPPSPASAPAEWLLAFIDVETTGLVPGWHEMIDIGIAMTDIDGRVLDTLFLRVQPTHPERLSAGARAVNAFDAGRWKTLHALSPTAAVDRILAFHRRVAGSKPTLMVAFNSQFDAAFLDHLFRTSNRSWREMYHYFVLDLPSMAWSLGLRDLRASALAERLRIPDEPHVAEEHTGITGAMVNVRIYRALTQLRGAGPTPP
jgi:oligoribonuclease (3'-5' exoribonuclease)